MKTAIALSVIMALAFFLVPPETEKPLLREPVSLNVKPHQPAAKPRPVTATVIEMPKTLSPETSQLKQVTVKNGDNMARIFQRHDLSATDLHNIMALGNDVSVLKKILPGQQLELEIGQSGELSTLRYRKDAFATLKVARTEDGFAANWQHADPDTLIVSRSAAITDKNPSLYHAGKSAGLSDNIIMKLSYIFQWDISFALDLREGDTFSMLYEEIYVDGKRVKEGNIIAATFVNAGTSHEAVRYTDVSGQSDYFAPDGRSLRKAFLRDPVHFSHISSSFNLRRLHPIHKRSMPHRGIDYAAPRGTPVVASGDGKVTIRRRNEASGNYIVIQHGEQYTTKYLHLSKFARGIRPGSNVRQGQTIGYVGATGWATGPHLHYEFLVHGVHRNPKTVPLPKADSIPSKMISRFTNQTAPVVAQLRAISGGGLASAAGMAGGE